MTADAFFPERSRRVVFDDVVGAFPFPLAITYARLQDELDGQEPVAAAWQLRDAFEGLIKFLASVAVADALHARPDRDLAAKLAGLLLKPSGLALGDWHTLIEMALEPLATPAKAGRLGECGRHLPALYGVFFDPRKGRRTDANYAIDGTEQSFVRWRNREFGHGVFRRDRAWYAAQTTAWLDPLHRLYDALRPVLAGWTLIGLTPDGERVEWQGAKDRSRTEPHAHEPRGEPLPMVLVHSDGRELLFGPMLSVQHCTRCDQPAPFFFDKNKHDSKKDRHRTLFLEYLGGHDQTHDDWDHIRQLASHLPAKFEWSRESHDPTEITEGITITFRDFETEYRRPDYLLDPIWQLVQDRPRGYIHLVGPEGFGKTYLVRGLEREANPPRRAVLAYHVLPGTTGRYQTFLVELNARAREQVRLRTPDLQIKDAPTPEAMQHEFADYLATLIRDNRLDRLVVAIDALDELPEPVSATRAITDFLPPADRLPKGCTIVLTSRETMRPRTAADLDRLRRAGPEGFTALPLRPDAPSNRELLRSYLLGGDHLPAPLRTAAHADALIDRAGGVFLYVFHLGRALTSGAFADLSALPEGHTFYPAYLARLRERAGGLYDSVYLPTLLLLCAAFQPVTLRQLSRWGIPRDRLPFALIDLKDFLRVHRVRLWHDSLAPSDEEPENRYEIAHEAFLRFVRDDATLAPLLQAAHTRIARAALPGPVAPWSDLDPTDDAQLYDLRHVLPHLDAARLEDVAALVRRDASYAAHCLSTGNLAQEKTRYSIAEDLHDRAVDVYRTLVEREGRVELANDLAAALMNKANAMQRLGRLAEAMAVYDQAIAMLQRLVEREGRVELAKALVNKAIALGKQEQGTDALACYEEAIHWREACVEAGMVHLLGELLMTVRYRMMTTLDLGLWDEAAADLVRLLGHAAPALQSGSPAETVVEELVATMGVLRQLSDDAWGQLEAGLGPWAEEVRAMVRGPG